MIDERDNVDWTKIERCKLRCMKCDYYWEEERPGQTQCPMCGYLYVDWLNYKEVLRALGRDI